MLLVYSQAFHSTQCVRVHCSFSPGPHTKTQISSKHFPSKHMHGCSVSYIPAQVHAEQLPVCIQWVHHTLVRAHTHTSNESNCNFNKFTHPPSLSHTCRHTLIEATVGSEWWALRATGQGPHEKPLCLGGTELRGQQVHQLNEGQPPAHTHIHTHTHTHSQRVWERGVQTQSTIDKRMMIHTYGYKQRNILYEDAHRTAL